MKELDQDNLKEIISNNNKVIVQYGASWCGMCKIVKPKFNRLSEENSSVEFLYVDAEKFPESRSLVKVDNLPTFASFANGQLLSSKSTTNEEKIKEMIDEIANH